MTTTEALKLAEENQNCREYLDRLMAKDSRSKEELCSLEIIKAVFNEYVKGVNSR